MSSLPKNGGQIPHLPEPSHGEREVFYGAWCFSVQKGAWYPETGKALLSNVAERAGSRQRIHQEFFHALVIPHPAVNVVHVYR